MNYLISKQRKRDKSTTKEYKHLRHKFAFIYFSWYLHYWYSMQRLSSPLTSKCKHKITWPWRYIFKLPRGSSCRRSLLGKIDLLCIFQIYFKIFLNPCKKTCDSCKKWHLWCTALREFIAAHLFKPIIW